MDCDCDHCRGVRRLLLTIPFYVLARFFQNDYGPDFLRALDSFQTYRKEVLIGKDGWLTASMSARDWNKDGTLEREPNISIVNVNNRRALQLDASEDHTSGVILRNTRYVYVRTPQWW